MGSNFVSKGTFEKLIITVSATFVEDTKQILHVHRNAATVSALINVVAENIKTTIVMTTRMCGKYHVT